MDDAFLPVPDVAALEALFARSHEAPILLFNHDRGCGGSMRAYGEMRAVDGDHGAIGLINVRVARGHRGAGAADGGVARVAAGARDSRRARRLGSLARRGPRRCR